MTSALAVKLGRQTPRIQHVPRAAEGYAAEDCIELAAAAGLHLDPWQQLVIRGALGVRRDGKWQAFEVGLIVPRQNGKGAIIEALELYWLFGCPTDRLILHSAHEFKTAREGFLRIRGLIEGTPELSEQVKQFYSSTGGECGIELLDGKRLRFVARSTGAGRGFSPDKLILDEAYNLPDTTIDAVLPSVGARPNPQVWYTSSPGDQKIAPCAVLARVRRRGIKGEDDSLAYFEWSVEYDDFGAIVGDPANPKLWAVANPSLGIRKTLERVATFHRSMSPAGFAREELGVGDWPVDEEGSRILPAAVWATLLDTASVISERPTFALDVAPNQSSAAIGVAGPRADGISHIEVTGRAGELDHRPGTSWVPARLAELASNHPNFKVWIPSGSAAESLVPEIQAVGVQVECLKSTDLAAACGLLFNLATAEPSGLRHIGQPELTTALAGAEKLDLSDNAWKWARRKSSTDITPLYAVTTALWVSRQSKPSPNAW